MEHAWGISGPQFLVLYSVELVLVLAWALRSWYRIRRPQAPAPGQQVGVAELAFLAGGPRRVAEAAIAQLVETGQIHVARTGVLTVADGTSSDDPLLAAVLLEVRRSRTAESVVRKISAGRGVLAIGDKLVEQRLLVAPAQAAAARRRAVLGLYAVGAVGVLRLVDGGLRLGRPVGYLFVLLLLTAGLVILIRRRRVKARTVHGDQVLATVRGIGMDESNRSLHPAVALAGVGSVVALGGLATYPDTAIRNAPHAGHLGHRVDMGVRRPLRLHKLWRVFR